VCFKALPPSASLPLLCSYSTYVAVKSLYCFLAFAVSDDGCLFSSVV
jgi:hypothetical protein